MDPDQKNSIAEQETLELAFLTESELLTIKARFMEVYNTVEKYSPIWIRARNALKKCNVNLARVICGEGVAEEKKEP
jgi:hypothetical protein